MTPTELWGNNPPTGWKSFDNARTLGYGVPTPPDPISNKAIGLYRSGNNSDLASYTSGWPTAPNAVTFYFNWGANLNPASQPLLNQYAEENRLIHIAMLSKITSTSWITWQNFANGMYDSAMISQLQKIDALPADRIIVSFDNEPDNSNPTAHAPNQTAASYKAAANRFYTLLRATCGPHVENNIHFAGGNASLCRSMLADHNKLENVSWDPYKVGTDPVGQTATQCFQAFINNVLQPAGYLDIPRHITETGIKVDTFSNGGSFDVATQIAFYQGWPAAIDACSLESVIWFCSNSGQHDYIPTDNSVKNAFRDMLDATIGA